MSHRFDHSLAKLIIAFACCAIPARSATAQTFQRLPPVTRLAQQQGPLAIDDTTATRESHVEPRTSIRFAGGSIQLQIPDGWWAEEIPFGREVRLIIAPQRPQRVRRMPDDGMWIVYHSLAAADGQSEEALVRELSARLRSSTGTNGQYSAPTPFQFGQWPAAVTDFTAGDPSQPNTLVTGRHVMVRTDWGVFEFHASAPQTIAESRSLIWTTTWDSLRLSSPTSQSNSTPNISEHESSIIGDWKSYRSRMQFNSNGRVVIFPDAIGDDRTPTPLTGSFDARDDLVFVRWDDGSRLNFRWKLHGNELLLTDHEGQISRLKRVFN